MQKLHALLFSFILCFAATATEPEASPVRFNTHFPGAGLGKIYSEGPDTFRCHVVGQYNECGRNRQCTWYYFRLDNVRGRDLTLVMTDLIGEYNGRPAVPRRELSIPVVSEDNENWTHLESVEWDNEKKELTLRLTPKADTVWIAHVPPYTHEKVLRLLDEIDRSPHARIEVFGRSVEDRPLHKVTVTDVSVPDDGKYNLWLMTRQHAWEAPTSRIGDGALRFLVSDTPEAAEVRKRCVLHVVPTLDPDGLEAGGVRFNRNGFDTNRHWNRVDLRSKEDWRNMPEICYAQKEILASHRLGRPIDLLVSLHNQERGDCFMTAIDDEKTKATVLRFEELLSEKTLYDSERPKMNIRYSDPKTTDTISALWPIAKIPSVTVEFRVERHPKLDRVPTGADYESVGKGLVLSMFEAVDGK